MTVEILIGDVFDKLATLESDSVDCCVSSFPYWGLRDYGVDGQIGLEPTLGEHIEVAVAVCEEIKRVLKPEGTFWLNYGDCYAAKPNGKSAAAYKADGTDDRTFRDKPFSTVGPIHSGKRIERGAGRWGGGNNSAGPLYDAESCGGAQGGKEAADHGASIPNGRIVSGGFLKPKDLVMMPNRVAIALQDAGWWVRSEIIWHKPNPMPESVTDRPACAHEKIFLLTKSAHYWYDAAAVSEPCESGPSDLKKMHEGKDRIGGKHKSLDDPFSKASAATNIGQKRSVGSPFGRNLRNVWTVSTSPFPGAHFATFPPKLVEPCIKAGCPAGGLVLDPFGGAGTTGLVADRLERNAILIELNPEYADLARRRIEDDAGMFAEVV